jgi:hypothetical protein
MKVIHTITASLSGERHQSFVRVGMDLPVGLNTFKIDETDPRWPAVQVLLERYKLPDVTSAKFTPAEMNAADFFAMQATWHFAYPEPDDGGYLPASFDLTRYCQKCGSGKRQNAPFRIKKAPRWGRNSVAQLYWIYDEFFVTTDAYCQVFEPLGISSQAVLSSNGKNVLDSILQLEVSTTVPLEITNRSSDDCTICGTPRYSPITTDFIPKPLKFEGEIAKSEQYFGSGGLSYRLVIVSKALYVKINEYGIKGVNFIPCVSN